MKKTKDEVKSFTDTNQVIKKVTTVVTLQDGDNYIDIVKDELVRLLSPHAGVRRLWCFEKPTVSKEDNKVEIILRLKPPGELSRTEILDIVSNNQYNLDTIYELSYRTVDLWYDKSINLHIRKNHR
jgi:hypothetical protein